jgi:prevent-host-death family protein
MSSDFTNLLSMEFLPLSEAKAKLSEQVRKILAEGKRIAITTNGRPTAVMVSYQDYLNLLKKVSSPSQEGLVHVIDYQKWKRGERERERVRDSILTLFDMSKLSRKGQKSYKQETLRELDQRTRKGT